MKKNYLKNILAFTLIEVLIGIVISSIMMAAMYTTYSVVNNSYSQVTDRAKISRSGRDIVEMLMRDIRMAGYKHYFGTNELGIPRVDNLDYDSDFRVPTIMDPLNDYATYEVTVGEIIDYMVQFAPSEFWHVNTQRRGICVTGGYYYPRVVVGLGDDWEIFANGESASVSGSGFGPGDEIDIDGGAKVRVVDVDEDGAIRDIEFVETTVEGTSVTYKERGSGFTPEDFPQGDNSTTPVIPQGKLIYLNSTSAGGTPATILWKSGVGYEQVVYDEGCQRRDGFTTPQRITPGSGAGNETVGEKWSEFDYATTIQLNPNPDTGGVKDNYEVFFFCQKSKFNSF